MSTLWHGLTDAQVLGMWDQRPWRARTLTTLAGIAMCDAMSDDDRLAALQTLGASIQAGLLPADVNYPEFARDVLLILAMGLSSGPRWWNWRLRRRLKRQLAACQVLLRTASQFLPLVGVVQAPAGLMS